MSDKIVVREPATGVETVTLAGEEITLTPFCNYKFQEGCRLLAEMIEECGIQDIMEALVVSVGKSTLHQAIAFAPILPKALEKLPESVYRFVALCAIPNNTLEELYDTDPGIPGKVKEQEKRILFRSQAPETVHAFGVFMGMLQMEELGNELRQAAQAFSDLVGVTGEEEETEAG
jgi:hypothetical protein